MKPREFWIHETDTVDGWKTDVCYSASEHLMRAGSSDESIHVIEKAAYDDLKKNHTKLVRLLQNCTLDPGSNKEFWNEVEQYLNECAGITNNTSHSHQDPR